MKKVLFIAVASVVMMTSCWTTWTTVGNYRSLEQQGMEEYRYDKGKQFYLFEGLIPLGHNHANTPNEPCEIKSKFNLGDFIVTGLTCGLISSRTVYVYAIKGGSNYPLETITPNPEPSQPKVEQKKSTKPVEKVEDEVVAKKNTPKKEIVVEENEDEIVVSKKTAPEKKSVVEQPTSSASQSVTAPTTAYKFKVGDRVVYKLKGQWWYYATITAIDGNNATIELENGAITNRSFNDIMKVEYPH